MAVERTRERGDAVRRFERLRRVVHALFPEARRRQRRRRLRLAGLVVLVAVVTAALLRGGRDLGSGAPASARSTFAVRSVALPSGGEFSSIAIVGGRLIVAGGPPDSVVVSGNWNLLVNGRAPGSCAAATVDPRTLTLSRVTRANCGDPALYGERVLPISYFVRGAAPAGAGTTLAVRIARANPAARDGYQLGPVVTTSPQCSDCQIGWIYGAGSLWLYNPFGGNPPRRSGVLLRISTRTGAVLERWPMPEILRALLAVDAHALWLAPSVESGIPGGVPRSRLAPYISLYRITPGERSPQRVFAVGGGGARWLVASGHTASAAIDDGRGSSVVWTFADGTPPVRGQSLDDASIDIEVGTGNATVAGDARTGFYSVLPGNGTEKVIHADPSGRDQRLVATIPAPGVSVDNGPPAGVVLDGSFYFLDPPTNAYPGATEQLTRLHRITER